MVGLRHHSTPSSSALRLTRRGPRPTTTAGRTRSRSSGRLFARRRATRLEEPPELSPRRRRRGALGAQGGRRDRPIERLRAALFGGREEVQLQGHRALPHGRAGLLHEPHGLVAVSGAVQGGAAEASALQVARGLQSTIRVQLTAETDRRATDRRLSCLVRQVGK
jgi:hypothetical protein